jgi:photosystem II stability/assembly factor-like uncharacterized protein
LESYTSIETIFARNYGGFINKKVGITVGYSGEINYTTKGDKKWQKGNNSSLCLFGLCILNDKTAYACGNGSCVVKTTDGGKDWYTIKSFGEDEPNHPRFLSFADEKNGWIATGSKFGFYEESSILGSTNDGGQKWNDVKVPDEIQEISAIYLRTPNDGYLIDGSGNLYTTADGGKSFKKQPLNLKDGYFAAHFAPNIALKFFDDKNAFIAYEDKNGILKAARSIDGGKTWTDEPMPDMQNGSLFLSPDGKMLTLTAADESMKILEYK